ncbi:ACT domain-containing protein [Halalkalibacter sp. APA_J-10(15)]|uniref:ACT domain-containing protein n=1 Tax=Halalkalibacter sp. APA_J-10(15) TaxID=2933805 RepID=UPI001FF353C8|nr:ACT domain-containing protein [Halalkalibacter sp. APA_J-10(15)]MCK0473696.1 ACT domain-containing protein [Halalkalibacter sp. APA_J-10(15)]
MKLNILDSTFSVVKFPPTETIPLWALESDMFSITRTNEELSIVCPSKCISKNEVFKDIEHDWKCIKVEGILDFSLTGILSALANTLAKNKISIFAISTYNTDYLLIKSERLCPLIQIIYLKVRNN